jgi:hypothetical protein
VEVDSDIQLRTRVVLDAGPVPRDSVRIAARLHRPAWLGQITRLVTAGIEHSAAVERKGVSGIQRHDGENLICMRRPSRQTVPRPG